MSDSTNQYDESAKGGFSYEEKLKMAAKGLINPKEIGLPDTETAALEVLKKDPPPRKLGDYMTFEASEVPVALRARWARQAETIIPPNPTIWEAEWIENHLKEHLLQCRIRCGTTYATLERLVTDVVPGFCVLLEDTAKLFRKEYAAEKEAAENPPPQENLSGTDDIRSDTPDPID